MDGQLGVRSLLLLALAVGTLAVPGSDGWAGGVGTGDWLASQHRLLSAAERYKEALRWPGGARLALARLGRVHLGRGEWQEAAESFRQAEAAGSSSREVLTGLATALDRSGGGEAALATLRRELQLRPEDADAWSRLVELAAGLGMTPRQIRRLLPGVPQLHDGTPLAQKVAYLEGSCLLDPASGEGMAALRRAASGSDGQVSAGALELLKAAGSAGSEDERVLSVGRVLLAQGLVGPALDYLERMARGSALGADAAALRGYALIRAGRLERAREAISQSLEIAPESALGWYVQGLLLALQGDNEGAVRSLLRAAALDPANPAVYSGLANALEALGDHAGAEEALKRAVDLAPESAELRLARARFYVDRQYRVEEGLTEAEEAVRLTGRSAESLGTMGWALHLVGRSREALDLLLEAVQKDPESPLLRYRLGSVYDGLNERDRAREQYLMVGELDGSGEHWRRAKAALGMPW